MPVKTRVSVDKTMYSHPVVAFFAFFASTSISVKDCVMEALGCNVSREANVKPYLCPFA